MPEIMYDAKSGRITRLISVWLPEDVVFAFEDYSDYADDGHDPLTEDEVDQVLSNIAENFDPNFGITWDRIIAEIDDILYNRGTTKEEPSCLRSKTQT